MHNIIPQPTRAGKTTLALVLIEAAVIICFATSICQAQSLGGANWKQIGPGPLVSDPESSSDGVGIESGMVRNIAIDPRGSTDQTIYIATDNGGIWKTTDGGTTWSPKTDSMPSLNMGAVALDPGNPSIVYAGTGNERSANNRRNGVGIYKSTDGGDNWQPTILGAIPGGGNIFSGRAINRIVLPAPNLLLVATDIGVYISFNGGASFFPSPTIGGDVTDLDVDTATPTTVYASIAGFGIFKSTDSGASFPTSPAIGNGPGNIFTVSNGGPSNFGFIAFTQSTLPNNQTMYVNVQLNSGPVQAGMFRSVTGGASWSQISVLNNDIEFAGAEGGYAQVVGVDPQDANRVYIGVRQLLMATDGGAAGLTEANRIDLNKVHVDQHALVFTPPSHVPGGSYQLGRVTPIYNGTDGGIATTANPGPNATWNRLNGTIATVLFRQIDIGRGTTDNNKYTYGAAQDLGLSSHRPDTGTSWLLGTGADGVIVAADPHDGNHAIASTNGNIFRSTTDGKSWPPVGASGFVSGVAVNVFLFDQKNGVVAYGAQANQLYQSSDPFNGVNFQVMRAFAGSQNISAVNMVNTDSNTIWLGRADGTVWHTSSANNGTSAIWATSLPPGAFGKLVTGVAIDPSNTAQVVVVYQSGEVYMTTDTGGTWTNISGNLPNLPVNAANLPLNGVVIDPNTSPHSIIVANDGGVWQTAAALNVSATWAQYGGGLPTVQCTSLALDSTAIPSLLRVGTYGRSAFELDYDRIYVNWQATGTQDGTREHPFATVRQAANAPTTGGTRFINIQAGSYTEGPITINQPATLNAINGVATIH